MSIPLSENTIGSINRIKNINDDREASYKIRALCYMKLNIIKDSDLVKYIPRPSDDRYHIRQGGWASIFSKTPRRAVELMDKYILKPSHPEKLLEMPNELVRKYNKSSKSSKSSKVHTIEEKKSPEVWTRDSLDKMEKEDLIHLILYPNFEVVKEKMIAMTQSGSLDSEVLKAYSLYASLKNQIGDS